MTQLIYNINGLTILELLFSGGYLVKSPSSNGDLTERADRGWFADLGMRIGADWGSLISNFEILTPCSLPYAPC